MKVLFVLSIGFDKQGPSVHLLTAIMEKCVERGIEVLTLFRGMDKDKQIVSDALLDNKLFSYDVVPYDSIDKNNFIARYLAEYRYANSCRRVYKKYKEIDCVFLQSNTVAFFHCWNIKHTLRCPILFNVQDIFPVNLRELGQLKGLSFWALDFLQRKGYAIANRIITISPDMMSTLLSENVQRDKLDYIFNWSYDDSPILTTVDENRFIRKYNISTDCFNVVYAGNIGRMQNVEILINAARILENEDKIHFYIIGDGVYKNKLEKEAEMFSNITFLPMQPSEYAADVYRFADINVIPLAKGGIKTALPSKTATCLRTNKPIAFCIGEDCQFSNIVSTSDKIYVGDSDNADSLVKFIKRCQIDYQCGTTEPYEVFCKCFKTTNSEKYVEALIELSLQRRPAMKNQV